MKDLKKIILLGFIGGFLFTINACKDDDSNDPLTCTKGYDQQDLLTNIVDNIITPSYNQFGNDVTTLENAINELVAQPSAATIKATKSAFVSAYTTFQHTSNFEIGTADELEFRANFNNFPPNTDDIQSNIETGVYDFAAAGSSLDYDKGFPALDYLLYGHQNSENDLVTALQTDENLQNYFLAIIADMKNRITTIQADWNTDRASFIDNRGTDAGSSLSVIINALNENYEYSKRYRLGDPAGVNALGITYPEGVEAYYSDLSIDLLKASLEASADIYKGIGFENGQNKEGLDDLLGFVDAQKGDVSLNEVILTQFETAAQQLNNINASLAQAIENDNNAVREAYTDYAQQVLYLKTDMPSTLCISITYIDNPSDSD